MSHFSQTLADLMEAASPSLSQAELEQRSGVHNSLISRFLNDRRQPDPEQVARLAAAISDDPAERAQLVVAYLRDVAGPALQIAGVDERHVIVQSSAMDGLKLGEPSWWEIAPTGLVVKLEVLGKLALDSPAVMALLDAWINQLCPMRKERKD